MLSGRECCQRTPLGDRKVGQDRRRSRSKHITISPRVGDDQQDVLEATVAQLEHDSADLALTVDQSRLCLDREHRTPTAESIDQRVPSSLIADDRQRDLRAEAEVGMKPIAQSTQQRDLPRIEDGIGARVGADANVKADRRADPRQLVDADALQRRPFDPPDLRWRHPTGVSDRVKRLADDVPGDPELAGDPQTVRRSKAASSIDRPLASTHAQEVLSHPLT